MSFSLLPSVFGRDWWDVWDYPVSIMDQCFATVLLDEDLVDTPFVRGGVAIRPRSQANIAASGKSEVTNDEKNFKIALNVSQFKPEELEVKASDNYVLIHGKHEERDDHGLVQREFTRRYMLPKTCENESISSSLSPDGILTISATKKAIEAPPKQERQIPISAEKQE